MNPKINSIYDALEYCSSSLSVGYTGIYPQTPVGKLVASALMTYGPALSGAMLDGPRKGERPPMRHGGKDARRAGGNSVGAAPAVTEPVIGG